MRILKVIPAFALAKGLMMGGAPGSHAQVKIKLEPYVTGVNTPLAVVAYIMSLKFSL
jgi:hypothetical protein